MKKISIWIFWIALAINFISHAIIGLDLLNDSYDFIVETYISGACFFIILVSSLLIVFGNKCPYCGKTIMGNGAYCSHCGKKIKE